MLFHNLHPAVAGAAPMANGSTSRRADGLTFDTGAGEAEDFNAFHNTEHSGAERRAPRRPNGEKKPSGAGKLSRPLLIGIIVAAVVLLLAVLVICVALSGDKNITYENNAYLAYADGDGKYHVMVNGKILDTDFEGEIELIPSADNSFAYVIDNGLEGKQVYLLEGKELTQITSSASPAVSVMACASLTPAVIVEEDDSYRLYVDDSDYRIVRKNASPENFRISADGSTVVYTAIPYNVAENAGERRLYIFRDGSAEPINTPCVPEAVSGNGDLVYVRVTKEGQNGLYVITAKDGEAYYVDKSIGFAGITSMNKAGDEIMFRISNGAESTTYLYQYKKDGEGASYKLRSGYVSVLANNPEVAVYETFAEVYFSVYDDLGADRGVYFINKDFTISPVAAQQGQFSPDGKYFYYVGATNSGFALKQVDLTDDNFPSTIIYDGVVDFEVTAKGNVYHVDYEGTLRFYKLADDQSYRKGLSDTVSKLSFYNYANKAYFSVADLESVSIYTSEEGSEKETAKLDSTQITGVPTFSAPHSKRCYAYYYDIEQGWMIFYTSSGKRFNLVTGDCQSINGVSIPDTLY